MPARKLNFDEFVHVITQRIGAPLFGDEVAHVKKAFNESRTEVNAAVVACCIKACREVEEQDRFLLRRHTEYVRTFGVTDNYGMRIDSNRRQPEAVKYFLRQEH